MPGSQIKVLVSGKGFGSENMSAIKMLTPSAGLEGVKRFILDAVDRAGPNPCPPIVVGIGIGGSFEKAAQLAKKAAMLPITEKNPDPRYAALEDELLEKINALGYGPAGLGLSLIHIWKRNRYYADELHSFLPEAQRNPAGASGRGKNHRYQ